MFTPSQWERRGLNLWVGKIPLVKGKPTHSSILAYRIPWTVQSMGSQRVRQDWVTFSLFPCCPGQAQIWFIYRNVCASKCFYIWFSEDKPWFIVFANFHGENIPAILPHQLLSSKLAKIMNFKKKMIVNVCFLCYSTNVKPQGDTTQTPNEEIQFHFTKVPTKCSYMYIIILQ